MTGATDGIGWMTARALARDGARVIVVGRNRAKGERRVAALRAETGNDAVGFELADLSGQGEIRALAARLVADLPRLDVLVNNVGAWFHRRITGPDGIEMTWALNHLGQFLLTGLLLDLLGAAEAGRIVNVASRAHRGPQVDFDDPGGSKRYAGWRAYQQSKLANILFTYRLAERLESRPVTANCLHPGFVASRFGHNNSGLPRLLAGAHPAPLRDQRGEGRRDQPLPCRRRRGGGSERALLRQVPPGRELARLAGPRGAGAVVAAERGDDRLSLFRVTDHPRRSMNCSQ